jgi:hypothetical protein
MRRITSRAALVFLAWAMATPPVVLVAQKHPLTELLWRDPGDASQLNLLYGAGGKAHAPVPGATYTFVEEDLAATSPKFDVNDAQGTRWKVKLGQEPQSETAATRLLWAAGYFVDEDYYLPEITVTGLPTLHRGQAFVSADGTVRSARLERHLKDVKKLGEWDWSGNPFLDTREFNGLRIMMALVNNWDLSSANNAIYGQDGERRYLVKDVGATFGSTGNNFTRSKGVLKDYADSKFIDGTTAESVDFVMHSRSFFLGVLAVNNYRDRARMEQFTRHIPRADARWLGQRLARLSDDQLRDAFRAGGYTPAGVDGYVKAVQKRIADLQAL